MDIIQIFAVVLASLICITIIHAHAWAISGIKRYTTRVLVPRLSMFHFTPRGSILPPLRLGPVLFIILYVSANLVCLFLQQRTLSGIGLRAGYLASINLILPLAGLSLSFSADATGVSLSRYTWMHRLTGIMSFATGLVHGGIMLQLESITFRSEGGLEMIMVRESAMHQAWKLLTSTVVSHLPGFTGHIVQSIFSIIFLRGITRRSPGSVSLAALLGMAASE